VNREQRRHREKALRPDVPPHEQAPPREPEVNRQGAQDVANVRAKSSGHGKKTADKWNQ
jgi:hypothetical protein